MNFSAGNWMGSQPNWDTQTFQYKMPVSEVTPYPVVPQCWFQDHTFDTSVVQRHVIICWNRQDVADQHKKWNSRVSKKFSSKKLNSGPEKQQWFLPRCGSWILIEFRLKDPGGLQLPYKSKSLGVQTQLSCLTKLPLHSEVKKPVTGQSFHATTFDTRRKDEVLPAERWPCASLSGWHESILSAGEQRAQHGPL